ncbi:uncharacterized protein LOC114353568 [Ostrinia furnacalis]|uniref:uncharacterized protein LOC114353568 n=1 Tax=Ostrinia furnacalis TaxID=93504 RepID=UPI00103FAE71|nr:uncharacterized protein LOC114353568 [Ostrinia furnacalis]
MDFNNKVVVITGASSGIGAECALLFAKASAKLALVGRNVDNLMKVANSCKDFTSEPLVIAADLCVQDDVKQIVNKTLAHFGRLDVLVNNAGIMVLRSIEAGIDAFEEVVRTNLWGLFLLTDLAMPHLIQAKGNVVNISSMLSSMPVSMMTAYCMSKAAVDMFTKCAAVEFGPKGVRVNAVNPGPVKTALMKNAGLNEEANDLFYSTLESASPLGKVACGKDVAEVVLFLASDKASCVTGSCYQIDCGASIRELSML